MNRADARFMPGHLTVRQMKMRVALTATALSCLLVVSCGRETPRGNEDMSEIAVKQVQPEDDEILEEWIRVTDDEDILGVSATRIAGEWPWSVSVSVAEFIRTDPLESELQQSIKNALTGVPGVTAVAHEDREVWIVQGSPKGKDLVRACSVALDRLSGATRKAVDEL